MISGVKIPDSKIAREAAELRDNTNPRCCSTTRFVSFCSAPKKPLTTFGTVNFDYIEYRDPTFHKPNACTRIRNTPWLS